MTDRTDRTGDLKHLASCLAQRQADWLVSAFTRASMQEVKAGALTLSLPSLFNVEVVSHTKSGRQEACLYPVEVKGVTPEEAVARLYEQVMMTATAPFCGKYIYEYLSQAGQAFEMDTPYKVIVHDDPEHDHASPRLIHLLPVTAVGRYAVTRGSLEGRHSHLLIQ